MRQGLPSLVFKLIGFLIENQQLLDHWRYGSREFSIVKIFVCQKKHGMKALTTTALCLSMASAQLGRGFGETMMEAMTKVVR